MARGRIAIKPRCPFCDSFIDRPKEVEPRRLGEFDYGACECGAVYVHDITGHNLGAAWVEAIGFACNVCEVAWCLAPGEDYVDAILENYDIESHLVLPAGRTEDEKMVRAALIFIRMAKDVREVTHAGVSKRLELAEPRISAQEKNEAYIERRSRRYSKQQVKVLVQAEEVEKLRAMALEDPLVLRKIQRLLYSTDEMLMWKAITTLGAVAGALATDRPTLVGDLVRRLLLASGDSAATNWGSIETIGEIIRAQPKIYGSFVRHIIGFVNDPPSCPAVLWAIGRIGELHPQVVRSSSFFAMFGLLTNSEPKIRGLAVWAFGRMKAQEVLKAIRGMIDDTEKLTLFDGQSIIYKTVGELASQAVERIEDRSATDQEGDEMNEQAASSVSEEKDKDKELSRAAVLYRDAKILSARGMSLDALQRFEEALEVFEAAEGRDVEVANICEQIGDLRVRRGNFKGAIPVYQRALAICEKKHDPVSTVLLAEKIIDLYRQLEELDKAFPYYFRALELVEELNDVGKVGLYLTGIGDIYQKRGDMEKALDAFKTARNIYQGTAYRERAETLEKGIKIIEEAMFAGASIVRRK
jgi:tetratricopeptide (TPR) repeat protein